MFNTVQQTVLESLIPTMAERGYHYYVAYTYTTVNSGYNNPTKPDLYVVFSADEISSTSAYTYNVPSGAIRYTIRSGNYSSSTNAVNTDRLTVSNFSGNLSIDLYEHVYTNAVASASQTVIQPDILKEGSVNHEYSAVSMFMLGSLLFYLVIRDMWHTGQSFTKKVKARR